MSSVTLVYHKKATNGLLDCQSVPCPGPWSCLCVLLGTLLAMWLTGLVQGQLVLGEAFKWGSHIVCVWRGKEGYRKAAWGVLTGRTTTLGPACQSTACFDFPEGLTLAPVMG